MYFTGTGDDAAPKVVAGKPGDPFLEYGLVGAKAVLDEVNKLPSIEERKMALKIILDTIDPALWGRVEDKAAKLTKGRTPAQALELALAASLANGLTSEIVDRGRGKKPTGQKNGGMGFAGLSGDALDTEAARLAQIAATLGDDDGYGSLSGNAPGVTDAMRGKKDEHTTIEGVEFKGASFVKNKEGVTYEGGPRIKLTSVTPMETKGGSGWDSLKKYVPKIIASKFEDAIKYNSKEMAPAGAKWSGSSFDAKLVPLVANAMTYYSMYAKRINQQLRGDHNIGDWDDKGKYPDHSYYIMFFEKKKLSTYKMVDVSKSPLPQIRALGKMKVYDEVWEPSIDLRRVQKCIVVIHKEAPDGNFWDGVKKAVRTSIAITTFGTSELVIKAAPHVIKAAGKVLDKLGDLGCKVANNPVAGVAITGAATVYGGPAGAGAAQVGIGVTKQLCAGGAPKQEPVPYVPPPPPKPKFPIVPVAIAGGGILLVLLLSGDK